MPRVWQTFLLEAREQEEREREDEKLSLDKKEAHNMTELMRTKRKQTRKTGLVLDRNRRGDFN